MVTPALVGVVLITAITLLMPRLINCRALRYAVIVTLPYDVGVWRESQQTLDCLSVAVSALRGRGPNILRLT